MFEFNAPIHIRRARRNNYSILETTENTTNDNKPSATRSLTLSVAIEEDADNLDSILDEFKARFCLSQSKYNFNLINSDHPRTFKPIAGKEIHKFITEIRKANQIATRIDSINKILIGLLCYDLHKSGMKLDDAAKAVQDFYSENVEPKSKSLESHDKIKQYYNDTRKQIIDIQRTLAKL